MILPWLLNWLQGTPITSNPWSLYLLYRFSNSWYCLANPHLEATFTKRTTFDVHQLLFHSILSSFTFPFKAPSCQSWPVIVLTVNSYNLDMVFSFLKKKRKKIRCIWSFSFYPLRFYLLGRGGINNTWRNRSQR